MKNTTYNYKQSNITSGSLYAMTYTRCPEEMYRGNGVNWYCG